MKGYIFKITLFWVLCLSASTVFATEKVDINTAPIEDLIKIKYIGEKRAQELINLRPFCSLDELTKIRGIGEKTLIAIKEQGIAWVDPNYCQQKNQVIQNNIVVTASTTGNSSDQKEKYYEKEIIINEILPSPDGPDQKEEWIELYNPNDFEINISSWQLKDKVGHITTYTFPENTLIGAKNFLVISRQTSKIVLNNDGDGVQLLRPNDELVSEVVFDKTQINQSYAKFKEEWQWTTTPTPGSVNILTKNEVQASTPSKPTKEDIKNNSKITPEKLQQLASLQNSLATNKNTFQNGWLIISLASIISILSAVIFLKILMLIK